MDPRVQREVIEAYNRRGKGSYSETFVDHTRNGAYLKINRANGTVQEISAEEYYASQNLRYNDGILD
jgi:uncharacterized protein YxeA